MAVGNLLSTVLRTPTGRLPALVLANLGLLLAVAVKLKFIWIVVRGALVIIGTVTLLQWIGYDFGPVLHFFETLPELFNLHETWAGQAYSYIFAQVHDLVAGVAENAPEPPDGQKIMKGVKNVVYPK